MYPLVWRGALRQRQHQQGRRPRRLTKLTLVTLLNVKLNILVHAWPIIRLQNALLCFEDAVVASEDVAVSVAEHVGDDVSRSHDDDTFLRRIFKSSPKDAVFNK